MHGCHKTRAIPALSNHAMIYSSIKRCLLSVVTALATQMVVGCAAGPDYVRPQVAAPSAYKEAGAWKVAQPQAIDSQHPWWALYGDSTLETLIMEANQANQT